MLRSLFCCAFSLNKSVPIRKCFGIKYIREVHRDCCDSDTAKASLKTEVCMMKDERLRIDSKSRFSIESNEFASFFSGNRARHGLSHLSFCFNDIDDMAYSLMIVCS